MKRFITLLLALLIVLSLAACGSSSTPAAPQAPADTQAPVDTQASADTQAPAEAGDASSVPSFENVKISAGSGTAGGTQYVYMGAIASIINSELDGVELILEGTSGTSENLALLQSGDLEMSCIESSTAYKGYTGEIGDYQDIRTLFVCMPSQYIAITKDMSVDNIEQFAGKIVAVGPVGGSTDVSSRAAYEALGLTDAFTMQNAGWGDCFTALVEDQVYAVTGQSLQPSSAITEAEASTELNFVQLTDEQLQTILTAYPYYSEAVLAAGTYKSLTEDYKTFSSWQAIYTRADLDDDLAYAITKTVFENLDTLVNTVSSASKTKLENINGQPIPLHPGAYRYYVEQGIEVPAELIPPKA